MFYPEFSFFHVFTFFVVGIILFQLGRSLWIWQSNNQAERLERLACLVTKRQSIRGGGPNSHASTTYYVTFEFEDKSRLELRVKGTIYGQLAEGDQGILTYQGTRFIEFTRK